MGKGNKFKVMIHQFAGSTRGNCELKTIIQQEEIFSVS
jgi:hypothetical protein